MLLDFQSLLLDHSHYVIVDLIAVELLGLDVLVLVGYRPAAALEPVEAHLDRVVLGVDVGDDVEDGQRTLRIVGPALSLLLSQLFSLSVVIQSGVIVVPFWPIKFQLF